MGENINLRFLSFRRGNIPLQLQRCQRSLFQGEALCFCKHFCPFWHPSLATVLFLASFVPLKLHVILKTSLFFVWIIPIFWMLMLASLQLWALEHMWCLSMCFAYTKHMLPQVCESIAHALFLYNCTPRNFQHLTQFSHAGKRCVGLIHLLYRYQYILSAIFNDVLLITPEKKKKHSFMSCMD